MAYSALRKLGTYTSAGLIALCTNTFAGDSEVKSRRSTENISREYAEQEEFTNIGGKDLYVRKTPEDYKIKLTAGDSSSAFSEFYFQDVAGTVTEKVGKDTTRTHKDTYALARLHFNDTSKKLEAVATEADLETIRIPLSAPTTVARDKLEEYQNNNKKLTLQKLTLDGKDFYALPTSLFTESLSTLAQTGITGEILMPTKPTVFVPRTEALADGKVKITEFIAGRVYALMPATLEEIKPPTTSTTDAKADVESGASEKKESQKK